MIKRQIAVGKTVDFASIPYSPAYEQQKQGEVAGDISSGDEVRIPPPAPQDKPDPSKSEHILETLWQMKKDGSAGTTIAGTGKRLRILANPSTFCARANFYEVDKKRIIHNSGCAGLSHGSFEEC